MDEWDVLRTEQNPPAAPPDEALEQPNASQSLEIMVAIGLEPILAILAAGLVAILFPIVDDRTGGGRRRSYAAGGRRRSYPGTTAIGSAASGSAASGAGVMACMLHWEVEGERVVML